MKLIFIPLEDSHWFHSLKSCLFKIGICRPNAARCLPKVQLSSFNCPLESDVYIHTWLRRAHSCKITRLLCLPSHPHPGWTGSGELGHVTEKESSKKLSLQTYSVWSSGTILSAAHIIILQQHIEQSPYYSLMSTMRKLRHMEVK